MGSLVKALKYIRTKVVGIPVLESIGRPIYRALVSKPELNKQRKLFKQQGLAVIEEFDRIMTENGFRYYLYFGTLLGAVREHGVIKHDFDFDVAMLNEDYTPAIHQALENAGFKLKLEVLVDDGKSSRHQNYEKNGIGVDIFWIYPPVNTQPYCCGCSLPLKGTHTLSESIKKYGGTMPVRIEIPFDSTPRRVPFEHLELPIPNNAEEILRICYGEDYMIPNPNWKEPRKISYKVEWTDKTGYVKQY